MLHLYALATHPARLPGVAGIEGSHLRSVRVAPEVDALVSEVSATGAAATEAAILAHAAVVEELARHNDALLPARFGAGYGGEEALAEALEGRAAQVRDALERVRGCVELGLRVFADTADERSPNGSSGRAYMLRRLDQVRSSERIAADVHEALGAEARESTSRVLASPQLLLSSAYLLPTHAVDSFRAALNRTERRHPELTFVCTGPWPPYSFALLDGGGG
jgi:Gas vesicle synthesis protein GvpL/GvpF